MEAPGQTLPLSVSPQLRQSEEVHTRPGPVRDQIGNPSRLTANAEPKKVLLVWAGASGEAVKRMNRTGESPLLA